MGARGHIRPNGPARRAARLASAALGLLVLAALPASAGGVRGIYPELRPATPDRAIEFLRGQSDAAGVCATVARLDAERNRPHGPVVRRAVDVLARRAAVVLDLEAHTAHGVRVRFTVEPTSLDRVAPADGDGNGTPDVVDAVLAAVERAHAVLVDGLGLPGPTGLDVVLLDLADADGLVVPSLDRPQGVTVLLDAAADGAGERLRHAAIHQFAHVVARGVGAGLAPGWNESLAVWAVLAADGAGDAELSRTLGRRLDAMHRGLLADDADLAPGNALWLSFIDHAYGPAALRLAVEELGRGTPPGAAFDLALRRASRDDLPAALREFHVWTVLTGSHADEHHFPFAGRLGEPRFATATEGLPALSVQAGPAIAPLGMSQVRLRPDESDGGLRIRVEGDFAALWDADLLLVGEPERPLRRVPLGLDLDGRGEITVPLDGVVEAWLLLRNLNGDDGASHRVTWAAHRERGFPYELQSLEAARLDAPESGVSVRWTTAGERRLVGFDVVRRLADDGAGWGVVTPVWIPALGEPSGATSYEFIDTSVRPELEYEYRIVGITRDGLTSRSRPVAPAIASED